MGYLGDIQIIAVANPMEGLISIGAIGCNAIAAFQAALIGSK